MEEGVSLNVLRLDETKAFGRIVPLNHGFDAGRDWLQLKSIIHRRIELQCPLSPRPVAVLTMTDDFKGKLEHPTDPKATPNAKANRPKARTLNTLLDGRPVGLDLF